MGIFLAVPLLIAMREVFSSFESTFPLAVVLGEDPCDAEEPCESAHEDEPIADIA